MEDNISSASFVSETAMVKCRVCQTSLRKKNYKTHLKNIHPKKDYEDLSGKDQLKLSNMFFRGKSSKKSEGSRDVVAESEVNRDVSIHFDDFSQDVSNTIDGEADLTANVSKKRKAMEDDDDNEVRRKRFGSGDSAFSETPFDFTEEETESNRPKRTKVDQILIELQEVKSEFRELKKSN